MLCAADRVRARRERGPGGAGHGLTSRARGVVLLLALLAASPAAAQLCGAPQADSPPLLRVDPLNPRYLTAGEGLLAGSHTWEVFQDYVRNAEPLRADVCRSGEVPPETPRPNFNFCSFLDMIADHQHTFTRGWHFSDSLYSPQPYRQDGGIFDLTAYDRAYIKRIKKRAKAVRARGLYVSVMLFQGWSVQDKNSLRDPDPWPGHPYRAVNNSNGVKGGRAHGLKTHQLGNRAITRRQKRYVEHMIDNLNRLDNIVWEISNESHLRSGAWQREMVRHIKSYERTKPKQHLVWLSCYGGGDPTQDNEELFASNADIISPCRGRRGIRYDVDPPAVDPTRGKVVIADTDHLGPTGPRGLWSYFLRGMHPAYMDGWNGLVWWGGDEEDIRCHEPWKARDALGAMVKATRRLKLGLIAMAPQQRGQTTPASSGLALFSADPFDVPTAAPSANGLEVLAWREGGTELTVDGLSGGATYEYAWYRPRAGSRVGGGPHEIVADGSGRAQPAVPNGQEDAHLVLHLYRQGLQAPQASFSTQASAQSPLSLTFDASASRGRDGALVQYAWDFDGDGTVDLQGGDEIVEFEFEADGSYTAWLVVTDENGVQDGVVRELQVGAAE